MSATNDVLSHSYNPYARREDAPLPPVPSSAPFNAQKQQAYEAYDDRPSPPYPNATSPFADTAYPANPKAGQQQYGAANDYFNNGPPSPRPYGQEQAHPSDARYHGYQPDPFDDRNAIPLRQHQKPGENTRYGEEEVGYAAGPPGEHQHDRPHRQHSRSMKKKRGWFAKPIPYVVYTLTLIQIIVFIAEIVKNGK